MDELIAKVENKTKAFSFRMDFFIFEIEMKNNKFLMIIINEIYEENCYGWDAKTPKSHSKRERESDSV